MYPNVKFRLHERRMTQIQLASELKINSTLLNKYLNGARPIPKPIREAIVRILERDEEWLFRKPW